ncbi:MFS transporter [Lawsonella clevelandensis]|uniref:Putative transporter YycB n=1 Tax=Lawsonella clevelandensis TaxID=1528099 RepID=A0A5E3ZY41_9ACTN|nr:MFS transporter [Lawsonella clevelandensis]VHO00578.1 putative transporter YycB [Lawsonella clevelandensis]
MKKTHLHVLLVVAVVLFALNMRAGVTSIAPVLQEIQGGLHMSDSLAGLLTSLPTLIFALVGLITPLASRTLGLHSTMLVAMVALSLGLIVRVFMGGSAGFLVFTIVALAGIAITNVLMPAFIKTHFPAKIPTYTAVYSTALTAMAFLSSVVVAPMSHSMSTGWRGALGFWGVLAVLAVVPAGILVVLQKKHHLAVGDGVAVGAEAGVAADTDANGVAHTGAGAANNTVAAGIAADADAADTTDTADTTDAADAAAGAEPVQLWVMFRSKKARALALFFGIQSLHAFVQMGWLAQIFRDYGVTQNYAGMLAGLMQLLSIPGAMLAPALLGKVRNPRLLVAGTAAIAAPAYLGMLLAPASVPWLWVILFALANTTFPMALTLIGWSGRSGDTTALLSSFVQSFGFLIASLGPLLVGILLQATTGWTVPLIFCLVLVIPFAIAGYIAAAPGYVDDQLTRTPAEA